MKYRVIIEVVYCEAYFDFDDIESAGDFAKIALTHYAGNEDNKKRKVKIRMDIIDPTIVVNENEEEDE